MDVLTARDFEGQRLPRAGIWVVNFTAAWCGFSREFLPQFERFQGGGQFASAIADLTDVDSGLWERFEVDVSPTLIVFDGGRPFFRRNGRLGYGLDDADLAAVRTAVEARIRSPDRPGTSDP